LGNIIAIDIKFLEEIFNSVLLNLLISQFEKNEDTIKNETLQILSIITGYKNFEFSFRIFDYKLFESLINFLNEKIDFKQIKFLGKILEILKNLFEIELLYFNDLLNEKENTFNFNENEIKFMKKFEEINGFEIFEKIILLQENDKIVNDVYFLLKLIDIRKEIKNY